MGAAYALPVPTNNAIPRFALSPVYSAPLDLRQVHESMYFFFGVGTGGAVTLDYLRSRGERGYKLVGVSVSAEATDEAAPDRGPKECLERVMAVMKPSVTELASAVGVSRQAIYAWLRGKRISYANAARLSELARAVDMVAAEDSAEPFRVMSRPLRDGKNFFALVSEGTPADYAAQLLIQIIRAESRERDVLSKHFAGRARPSRESFQRVGVPTLDERG